MNIYSEWQKFSKFVLINLPQNYVYTLEKNDPKPTMFFGLLFRNKIKVPFSNYSKTCQLSQNLQKMRMKVDSYDPLTEELPKRTQKVCLSAANIYWSHEVQPTSKKPIKPFSGFQGGERQKHGIFRPFAKRSAKRTPKENNEESPDAT